MTATVSTHVLDAVTGTPAAGVAVVLTDADGTRIAAGSTDADGRIGAITPSPIPPGRYRLAFDTGAWFAARGRDTFYPEVVVAFDHLGGHCHVPLLLSPFAYSTYRGS
ncbi:hydroxyisourate hydrolase [Rhodococcus gannanensis]|uniref:5-hydroxyisourate hydrolase n=1 Tax=Rhodococcus gannanensis TaxID=1960308 RepID=A0ABW4P523_9NOCA